MTGHRKGDVSADSYLIETVRRYCQGSPTEREEAFQEFRDYFNPDFVEKVARRVLSSNLHIDDVQSAFYRKAREKLHTIRGTTNKEIKGWVESIIHNTAVDVVRRYAHDPSPISDQLTALLSDQIEEALIERQRRHATLIGRPLTKPLDQLGNKARIKLVIESLEQMQWLQAYLKYLAPRQRQCIELRAIGLSNPEIAHELGIANTTVACHVSQGCATLVKYIKERRARAGGPSDGPGLV